MSQNIGTLVTAAIRPNSDLDLIASAYSNEILGGHHTYATLLERDNIFTVRRQWGMYCTIYNDTLPANNKTYQLTYNYIDSNINNNNNWIIVSTSGSGGFKGTYDASTPGVFPGSVTDVAGDFWIVSVGGTQSGLTASNAISEYLEIGDLIYSLVNSPDSSTASDYFAINKNISYASNSQTIGGTFSTISVTPAGLSYSINQQDFKQTFGNTISLTYSFTHNFNSIDYQVEVVEVSSGDTVIVGITRTSLNTVMVSTFPAPGNNALRITLKKNFF